MLDIPVQITATLIGLTAGAAGYALREFRNRIRPFFDIITIDGRVRKYSDQISVSATTIAELKDTFYIRELKSDSNLKETYLAWDECDDLKRIWPEVKRNIEQVLVSKSDVDLCTSLATLLSGLTFEKWMVKLLLNNKLDFEIDDSVTRTTEKIRVWYEDKDDEAVWFDFPSKAVSFGKKVGHPAIRAKYMPFIHAISHLHKDGLDKAFKKYIAIFDEDHRKALSAIHDLNVIINANSRWALHCFIANNSQYPILIETDGEVTIIDSKSKTRYSEKCYLANTDEKFELTDTSVPLVVKPGDLARFAMITQNKQREMKLGDAMRETFDRCDGYCHVSARIRRTGFFKKQKCISTKAHFVQNGSEKASE